MGEEEGRKREGKGKREEGREKREKRRGIRKQQTDDPLGSPRVGESCHEVTERGRAVSPPLCKGRGCLPFTAGFLPGAAEILRRLRLLRMTAWSRPGP